MYRILVADDEPIERAVVNKIISANLGDQLEVVLAANGREAVEKYESGDCKIALLDIAMPGIDGLEAARQIREKYKSAVLIFLTAFDEFDYAKKAISVQAMEFLLKPVDENELVTVLEDAIRRVVLETGTLETPTEASLNDEELADGRQAAIRKEILEYIEANYVNDISLTDAAMHLKYSDAYFSKVFKACFNKGFVMYLTDLRVEKAKQLLGDITVNVKDVSAKAGFRDSNYFAKVFKRLVGMTPSEYRIMRCKDED